MSDEPEATEEPDCDALADEFDRLDRIAAERSAFARQTYENVTRLDAELTALARSWGDASFEGDDWREYEQHLLETVNAAGSTLDALERDGAPRSPEQVEADLDAAWEEVGRLADRYVDLHAQWETAIAQISGDEDRDMSQPLGGLMDHAERLREQMEEIDAQIEALMARIGELNAELADAQNAPAELQEARDAFAAAEEARTTWEEASADLKFERSGQHIDTSARDAANAEAEAQKAAAEYERKCGEGDEEPGDGEEPEEPGEPEDDDGTGDEDGDDTGLE